MNMPSFTALDHPSFPLWMREGLDALFAADSRIKFIHFDLWAHSGYNDNSYTDLLGSVMFKIEDGQEIPEEDLDRIPQVRMFERRAKELWDLFPLVLSDSDGEAMISGNYEFYASNNGEIRFWHQVDMGEDQEFLITACFENGSWTSHDQLVLPFYDGSLSDLLAMDAAQALAHVSPDSIDLESLPVPTAVSIGENDEVLFELTPGELTRCMPSR